MKHITRFLSVAALFAGLTGTAHAQLLPVKGALWNKFTGSFATIVGDNLKSNAYNAGGAKPTVWEFNIFDDLVSIKGATEGKYIGKPGALYAPVPLADEAYGFTVENDYEDGGKARYYSFVDPQNTDEKNALHSSNGHLVRWTTGVGTDTKASRWFIVDEDHLDAYTSFVDNRDRLLRIAEIVKEATGHQSKTGAGLITSATQLSTNAQEILEGPIANLIDGNPATFFHTSWSSGSPKPAEAYNIGVTFNNASDIRQFQVDYTARDNNDHPTTIQIYGAKLVGTNYVYEDKPFTTVSGAGSQSTSATAPGGKKGYFQFSTPRHFDALRFDVTATNSGHKFFTYSEFQLFATTSTPAPRTVEKKLVTSASQIWSNAKEKSEGSYAALIDDKDNTFFHSSWSAGSPNVGVRNHNICFRFDNLDHFTQFKVNYKARKTGAQYNNRPKEIKVYGGPKDGSAWTLVTTLTAPAGSLNGTGVNGIGGIDGSFTFSTGSNVYEAFRFDVTHTQGPSGDTPFFTYAEFHLTAQKTYPASSVTATYTQLVELERAMAFAKTGVQPYTNDASYAEGGLHDAINNIVPKAVETAIDFEKAEEAYEEANAEADAQLIRAEKILAKDQTSTVLLAAKQAELNAQQAIIKPFNRTVDDAFNAVIGGAGSLTAFKAQLDELKARTTTTRILTADLMGHNDAWVDPATQTELVPIEPWMDRPYAVHWSLPANLPVSREDRYSTGLRAFVDGEQQIIDLGAHPEFIYNDLSSNVVECNPGAELSFEPQYNNQWMHAYVFVDVNRDSTFTWTGVEPGTVGTELVAYSYLKGYNSTGHEVNPASTPLSKDETSGKSYLVTPSFNAPILPGDYRVRVKIDWNCADPAGQFNGKYKNNFINDNGGYIYDVTLRVKKPTAVERVAPINKQAKQFDLTGRRVVKPVPGQILISGGKKQIVK